MKLASYSIKGRESYGIVRADGIVDLGTRLSAIRDLKSLLEAGLDKLEPSWATAEPDINFGDVTFLPVIPNPEAIFCVGLNTRSHYEEVQEVMGLSGKLPARPWLFMRTARAQTGHLQPLERPNGSPLFDYEGEIAIVIGRKGRFIAPAEALKYVAGYACFNDGTVRDFQMHSPLFTSGKNFPRSGSFGPWLVTTDEIPDPETLRLQTRVNGVIVQDMPYSDLIFTFPELISYISDCTELRPGDVIVTGCARGVGIHRRPRLMLRHGDVCEVEVEGIGTLTNPVADAQGPDRAPITRSDVDQAIQGIVSEMQSN